LEPGSISLLKAIMLCDLGAGTQQTPVRSFLTLFFGLSPPPLKSQSTQEREDELKSHAMTEYLVFHAMCWQAAHQQSKISERLRSQGLAGLKEELVKVGGDESTTPEEKAADLIKILQERLESKDTSGGEEVKAEPMDPSQDPDFDLPEDLNPVLLACRKLEIPFVLPEARPKAHVEPLHRRGKRADVPDDLACDDATTKQLLLDVS
jgi:hypothetical protein